LSYRDLVAMMGERGIDLAHTTILRWVQHYSPEFQKRWNRFALDGYAASHRAVGELKDTGELPKRVGKEDQKGTIQDRQAGRKQGDNAEGL
jgi:hypothetical protein